DADDPPFFSEAWWEIFLGVCEDARELGVSLWFYDQFGFSGSNLQAKLIEKDRSFAAQALKRICAAPGETGLRCPPGCIPLPPAPMPNRRTLLAYAQPPGESPQPAHTNPAACAALRNGVHAEYQRRAGQYFGSVIVGSFQDELWSLPTWNSVFAREFQRR